MKTLRRITVKQLKRLILEAIENEAPADAEKPEFEIVDGVLVKYNGKGGNVVIPKGVKSISGYKDKDSWKQWRGAFENNLDVISVKLPNGIEELGIRAFYGCNNLAKINFPDTLKTIRTLALDGTGLKKVVIPASVNIIEVSAFGYALKSAIVENPHAFVDEKAFQEKTKVMKKEGNLDTLARAAADELLTPEEESKCGHLRVEIWTRYATNEEFVKIFINRKEHELDIGPLRDFASKVRDAVTSAGGVILNSVAGIPTRVRKFGKPSHEWDVLTRIVEKYSHVKLDPMKCKIGYTSGKRGQLDAPYEWDFIAFDYPDWCARMTEWIRKTKGSRDTLKVSVKRGESCDNRSYSSRYEVECSGSMIETYEFSVITPTGKSKGSRVLSYDGFWHDS